MSFDLKGEWKMKSHGCLSRAIASATLLVSVFTAACSGAADDLAQVQALQQSWLTALNARDINGMMAVYVPDNSLLVFDAIPPRQYVGAAAFRQDNVNFLAAFPGPVKAQFIDFTFETEDNLAYGHGILDAFLTTSAGKQVELTPRQTDVYRKINGQWLIIHEHLSWPVDPSTGQADLQSKP
jgi:uncharacterized protein (TIGR02246 family)